MGLVSGPQRVECVGRDAWTEATARADVLDVNRWLAAAGLLESVNKGRYERHRLLPFLRSEKGWLPAYGLTPSGR